MKRVEKNLSEGLVNALREELREYGGILALMQEQRAALMHGDAGALTENVIRLEEQVRLAVQCRERRELFLLNVLHKLSMAHDSGVRDVLDQLPEPYRPLIEALVDEGMRLLEKLNLWTKQNRAVLARANEVNETLLLAVNPGAMRKTYSRRGMVELRQADNHGRLTISA